MATRKLQPALAGIRRDLKSLRHRVSWLEAALKPKRQRSVGDPGWADFERKAAEQKARDKALAQYYEKEREESYRRNPNLLRIVREQERKEGAFLRSRGLEPSPSRIPRALQKKAP